MEIKDILELIKAVSDKALTSFELKEGDFKLSIKKEIPQVVNVTNGVPVNMGVDASMMTSQIRMDNDMKQYGIVPDEFNDFESEPIDSGNVIVSPLVGTFYNAASPESEPFVKEGDTVKKGQVLGIIEAMKLMNEIESEFDGVVEAILANNEEVVEYGQPLFRIR